LREFNASKTNARAIGFNGHATIENVRGLKIVSVLLGCTAGLLGQYTAERTGAAPAEIAARVTEVLQPSGFGILNAGVLYCEVWMRASLPDAPSSREAGVTLNTIPAGTLVGVIRFDAAGSDRRGQRIAPGLYTLRYAVLPKNEAHEGVSRQRDFLVLTPAAEDINPDSRPSFDALVKLSTRVSGTPHPAILTVRKAEADSPGFSQEGEDWVLQTKLGTIPVQVILIGSVER